MTKEPIMIDGVNVLDCGYYSQFEGKTENACHSSICQRRCDCCSDGLILQKCEVLGEQN